MTTPDVRALLSVIGWELAQWDDGTPYAIDSGNAAIRISDRWGPEYRPEGRYTCGSRGPSGSWADFVSAVEVAHGYHMAGQFAARVRALEAERDELHATLLNERGEGAAPVEGWEWSGGVWDHGTDDRDAYVERGEDLVGTPSWEWGALVAGKWCTGTAPTARAAMKAASLALNPPENAP